MTRASFVALAGLVIGIGSGPAPATALRLFDDPARSLGLGAAPIQMMIEPGSNGRRLVVLDDNRRVHYIESQPAGWREIESIDLDGFDEDGYGYGGRVRVPDIDGDGQRDLVVLAGDAFVALRRPDGGFAPTLAWRMSDSRNTDVVDLDGDGRVDLFNADDGTSLFTWRRGLGDGRFEPLAPYGPVTPPRYDAQVGDWDDDGDLDVIATTDISGNRVQRWINNGDGTFRSLTALELPDSVNYVSIQMVRMSGDAIIDLLVYEYTAILIPRTPVRPRYVLYTGLPDGTFGPAIATFVSDDIAGWSVGDIDDDGQDDLYRHDQSLVVRRSRPDGTFGEAETIGVTGSSGQFLKRRLDDGTLEYITAGAGSVRFLHEQDLVSGRLALPSPIRLGTYEPILMDVTGDDIPDLVGYDRFPGRIAVCAGRADGTFESDPRSSDLPGSDGYDRPTLPGDLDGDGDADLVLRDVNNTDRRSPLLLVNDGTGRFTQVTIAATTDLYRRAFVSDMDGDGRAELVIVPENSADRRFDILGVHPDGSVEHRAVLESPDRLNLLQVGDMDGDGLPEIVTSDYGSYGAIRRWSNRGGMQFELGPSEPFPVPVSDLRFGHWLQDDRVEALAIESGGIHLVVEDGDGGWIAIRRLSSRAEFEFVDQPDLNGDGRTDLHLTLDLNPRIDVVLLSEPGRGFGEPTAVDVPASTSASFIRDVDRDGQPDLVVIIDGDKVVVRHGIPPVRLVAESWTVAAEEWQVTCRMTLRSGSTGRVGIRRQSIPIGFQPEEDVATLAALPGVTDFVDTTVPYAGRFRYRLVSIDDEGYAATMAQADVTVRPGPAPARLSAVSPAPGPGPFELTYEARVPAATTLDIIAPTGRRVRRIDVQLLATPRGTLTWDGRSDDGGRAPSGVYFARVAAAEGSARIVVVR